MRGQLRVTWYTIPNTTVRTLIGCAGLCLVQVREELVLVGETQRTHFYWSTHLHGAKCDCGFCDTEQAAKFSATSCARRVHQSERTKLEQEGWSIPV